MRSYDVILSAMINHSEKEKWTAKDFQKEPYFVGYEATARMSELQKMIPGLFIAGKEGRFRTLSINWKSEHIGEYLDLYLTDY